MKVNFRIEKETETIIAVLEKYPNGKYLCYSFDDDCHFDSEKEYLADSCKPLKNYDSNEIIKPLLRRGYNNIEITDRLY